MEHPLVAVQANLGFSGNGSFENRCYFGLPYSICRPPRPGNHNNLSATVAMVIMEPAVGEPLPALNRVFTRYSLEDEPVLLAA